MIGLHDHDSAHSTRVARTVEKIFASFSPGRYCDTNAASIEIIQLFPPSVSRVMFKAGAYWWQIGEHFGMSQQTAYETVKRAKKKRGRK